MGRFLSGESDADEAAGIAVWLAEHPEDARLVDAMRDASQQLASDMRTPVDTEHALAAVKARRESATPVLPSIEAARTARRKPSDRVPTLSTPSARSSAVSAFPRWGIVRAVAAAVIVAAGLLVWRTQRDAPAPATQIAVAPGARDSVRLPDGTRVLLGPGSSLTYEASYGDASREVVLQGDGFFEVSRDDTRPFTVRAADAVIVDLGTAFTVRSDAVRGVAVAVTSGRVRLARAGETAHLELGAGDAGVLPVTGASPVLDSVPLDDALAWTTGTLVFRDASFAEVAIALARWYGVAVTADSGVQRARVTATFREDSRATVLETLALSYGATFALAGDTVHFRVAGASPR